MASPASCTTRTVPDTRASLSADDMSAGKLPCESESTCSCPGGTNSHSFCPQMLTDQLYDLYKMNAVSESAVALHVLIVLVVSFSQYVHLIDGT